MKMREPKARVGKMCAMHASGCRKGRLSVAVCVDVIMLTWGRRAEMSGSANCLFVYGAVLVRKWPVQPVLAMIGDGDEVNGGGEEAWLEEFGVAILGNCGGELVDSSGWAVPLIHTAACTRQLARSLTCVDPPMVLVAVAMV